MYTRTMWSRVKAWCRRGDLWALCGVGLGLLLLLVRWWFLHAGGEELQREVRRAQAEYEELRPIIREVSEFKTRQNSLQSLIIDLIERPKLFQATEAVLAASEPDVFLERLELHGLDVRILARADEDRSIQRFMDSLRENGGFLEVTGSDEAPNDDQVPSRFVVRGELQVPWPGVDE